MVYPCFAIIDSWMCEHYWMGQLKRTESPQTLFGEMNKKNETPHLIQYPRYLQQTNKKEQCVCVPVCETSALIIIWYMSVYKTCKLLLHLFKRYVYASRLENSHQNLEKQRVIYHLITLQPICITLFHYIYFHMHQGKYNKSDHRFFNFLDNLFAVFICESNYSINKNSVFLYLALSEGCSHIYKYIGNVYW